MAKKDNILSELQELNTSLTHNTMLPYVVPAGYFENLTSEVLRRIKALEAVDAKGELECLSPFLNRISREMPFEIPAQYFEELDPSFATINEEVLSDFSPVLAQVKKEMSARPSHSDGPYSVPTGYFDQVSSPMGTRSTDQKVVSFNSRKWLRYAAAAVVTGVFILAAFYFTNQREAGAKAMAGVTRDVKKMDEVQKDKLLDFIEAGMNGEESVQTNAIDKSTIKNLIKGISEEELEDFHEQTEAIEDVLMTN